MKRKFLVSYWVTGRTYPENHEVTLENVTDFEVPIKLQKFLADYETFDGETYCLDAITILNFWEIE